MMISEEYEMLTTRRRRLIGSLGSAGEESRAGIEQAIKELELRLLDMCLAHNRKVYNAENPRVRIQSKKVPRPLQSEGMRKDDSGPEAEG